jgi:hypothetical protein
MSDTPLLPDQIAGIRIPDSPLARAATRYARELSSDVVFNHVIRSFVFGGIVACHHGIRYDEELFYLGAVLHDLGLTGLFPGPERFEVAGADAADAFLKERGVPAERREIVWDAIALHTSVGIASRKRPEIALVHIGAGVDVLGLEFSSIPGELMEQVLAAVPRRDFKKAFGQILLDTVQANPQGAMMTFLEPCARRHLPDYPCPDFMDAMGAAPFAD